MNDNSRVGIRCRFFGPGIILIVLVDAKQAAV